MQRNPPSPGSFVPFLRTGVEADEARRLAPYAQRSAESKGRLFPEPEDEFRTVFQRDRDRVLHSTAFRRLLGKTQVFVSDTGDHYRVRLTHSLEVAQIARAISRTLRLNEDLTEAIALAHDLGHAPFGHVGGDVLQELMKGHGGFEHNRQSLRIVEKIESSYPAFDGLNLSYEVKGGLLKHRIDETAPAFVGHDPALRPCLEAEVADWADGIAYNSHDLDDGLRSGILQEKDVEGLAIWNLAKEAALARHGDQESGLHRGRIIAALINLQVKDLVRATAARLVPLSQASPGAALARKDELVGFSKELREPERELRLFLHQRFYTHYKVNRMRRRAREIVVRLFEALSADLGLVPPRYRRIAEEDGPRRAVADYISGMTDRYAQKEYGLLFLPSPGSLDP